MATSHIASKPLSSSKQRSALLRLPIEIKTIIIQMLVEQDTAFLSRSIVLQLKEKNSCYGKSCRMMFLVNREMNELAAVHLFEELIIDNRIQRATFKYLIARRRGHLVKHLNFPLISDEDDSFTSADIVLYLPLFSNITSLTFQRPAYWILEQKKDYGHQVFSTIAAQLKTLDLSGITYDDDDIAISLIKTFANLETLKIRYDSKEYTTTFELRFQSVVSKLSKLKKLSVFLEGAEEKEFNDDGEETVGSGAIVFSSSLIEVEVELDLLDLDAHQEDNTALLFWLSRIPNLKRLKLSNFGTARPILPPLPYLTTLHIDDDPDSYYNEEDGYYMNIKIKALELSPITHLTIGRSEANENVFSELTLSTLKSLKYLTIETSKCVDADKVEYFRNLSKKFNFEFNIESREYMINTTSDPESAWNNSEAAVVALNLEMKETLEYGLRSLEVLKTRRKLWRTIELIESLKELRRLFLRDEKD